MTTPELEAELKEMERRLSLAQSDLTAIRVMRDCFPRVIAIIRSQQDTIATAEARGRVKGLEEAAVACEKTAAIFRMEKLEHFKNGDPRACAVAGAMTCADEVRDLCNTKE